MDPVSAVILVPFHFVLIALCLQPYLRILKNEYRRGGGQIQFTIFDCWASMAGLFPTAWAVAQVLKRTLYFSDGAGKIFWVIMIASIIGSSQVAGIVVVLATNISPSRKSRHDVWSAIWVFSGAMIGLLTPLLAPFLIIFDKQEEMRRAAALRINHRVNARLLQKRARIKRAH